MATITVSPDGTKDYTTIADAITAAASGDIINVYDGLYSAITITKPLTIKGIGCVVISGGLVSNYSITKNAVSGDIYLHNLKCVDGAYGSYNEADNSGIDRVYMYDCVFTQDYKVNNQNTWAKKCEFNNFVLTLSRAMYFFNCNFSGDANLQVATSGYHLRVVQRCQFNGNVLMKNLLDWRENNILPGVSVTFTGITPSVVNDLDELEALYETETGAAAVPPVLLYSTKFYTPIYSDDANGNYVLDYDVENNPIAFATFEGEAIGAHEAGICWVMDTVANGGDVELLNLTKYANIASLFAGITNVGVIGSGEISATGVDATNWGVFLLKAKSLPKAHIIKRMCQLYGDLNNRNDNEQISVDSDNSYQIDELTAYSTTQTNSELEADTDAVFINFRYRPNENNYYVDNGGILVGDGDPDYMSLVSSTDGGSGSLEPIQAIAKSIMKVVIIRNVV